MSPERVDDGDPFDLPAVAHVFGIELVATECTRRGDDRAVPVREAVSRFDLHGAGQDRERDLLDLEPRPRRNKAYGGLVSQRMGPRAPRFRPSPA